MFIDVYLFCIISQQRNDDSLFHAYENLRNFRSKFVLPVAASVSGFESITLDATHLEVKFWAWARKKTLVVSLLSYFEVHVTAFS